MHFRFAFAEKSNAKAFFYYLTKFGICKEFFQLEIIRKPNAQIRKQIQNRKNRQFETTKQRETHTKHTRNTHKKKGWQKKRSKEGQEN